MPQSKAELRKLLRIKRKQIDSKTKELASAKFCQQAQSLDEFIQSDKIGIYLNTADEAPTDDLIKLCYSLGKRVYVPVITDLDNKEIMFAELSSNQPLIKNSLGILEPEFSKENLIDISELDTVFMPLLGFDRSGNRIGMGAGYYDRALAKQNKTQKNSVLGKISLIGLAFSQQEHSNIPNDLWDVPLGCIITPQDIIRTNV